MKTKSSLFAWKVLLLLLVAPSLSAFEKIPYPMENRYVPREDFLRIREFFSGKEDEGNRLYLRSQPEFRRGYYWMIPKSDLPDPAVTAEIVLETQIPGSSEISTFRFPFSGLPKGKRNLWIGITGTDCTDSNLRPVAWRLQILDQNGAVQFAQKSYLWN